MKKRRTGVDIFMQKKCVKRFGCEKNNSYLCITVNYTYYYIYKEMS